MGRFNPITQPLTESGKGWLRGEKTTEVGLATLTDECLGSGSRGRATGKIPVGVISVKPRSCWDLRRALRERHCLVDQHDRDSVPHRISEFAALANQRGFLLAILQLAAALGTHENLE